MIATEEEIITVMTVMDERTKRVVLEFMDRQKQIELEMLLVPNLSNEGAHYNRGRVAALESIAFSFNATWQAYQKAG